MSEAFESDLLKDTVARILAEAPDELPDQIQALGLLDLLVPEAAGGAGCTLADALVVYGELGRGLGRAPFLQCMAARIVLGHLDLPMPEGWGSLSLDADTLSWTVTPGEALVPFGDTVERVLVWEAGQLSWMQVSGAQVVETVDPTFPLFRVDLSGGVAIASVERVALEEALELATIQSRAALCAEMLGSAERCVDTLHAHLTGREQFGHPIGSFQAVQHKAADVAIRLEGMRSYLQVLGDADPQTSAMAKAYVSEGARFIAETSLQLFGGMGFTWEHPVHHHLRHAHRCGQLLGAPGPLRQQHIRGL